MADSYVQLPTGPLVSTQRVTNGAAQTVQRETVTIGDPDAIGGVVAVKGGSVAASVNDGAMVMVLRPDAGGSVGVDYSANQPTLPVVGAAFAGSGPYASWVLVKTIPANAGRSNIEVQNMSGTPIALLRDDGVATAGSAPANASIWTLNPKVVAGPAGGEWKSRTFRGRLQIYAASSGAVVAAFID